MSKIYCYETEIKNGKVQRFESFRTDLSLEQAKEIVKMDVASYRISGIEVLQIDELTYIVRDPYRHELQTKRTYKERCRLDRASINRL